MVTNLASRFDLVTREERKPLGRRLIQVFVIGPEREANLTGVAWNVLSTLLSFCFTW